MRPRQVRQARDKLAGLGSDHEPAAGIMIACRPAKVRTVIIIATATTIRLSDCELNLMVGLAFMQVRVQAPHRQLGFAKDRAPDRFAHGQRSATTV
jgi:hypothetical protein